MNEQISALMDGEWDPANDAHETSMDSCLDGICQDQRWRQDWTLYHLISDHLRGDLSLTIDCLPRLNEPFSAEPAETVAPSTLASSGKASRKAAWFAFSALVAMMGIAAIGWVAWSLNSMNSLNSPPMLAIATAPEISPGVEQAAPSLIAEGNRDYLLAHQGVSPSGVLQGISAYVRTVSETTPAHGMQAR
jgi:sigma-E factor negative regulatory protein RseA